MVRWTALRAGDLDYINFPPPNVAIQEKKNPTPGVVTVLPQPVGTVWVYINVTKPPFDNKKVRQAFAYAIDKHELIKAASGDWVNRSTINLSSIGRGCTFR